MASAVQGGRIMSKWYAKVGSRSDAKAKSQFDGMVFQDLISGAFRHQYYKGRIIKAYADPGGAFESPELAGEAGRRYVDRANEAGSDGPADVGLDN
jgi:hypothetical protein